MRIMIMWLPGGAEGLFQEMRDYLQGIDGDRTSSWSLNSKLVMAALTSVRRSPFQRRSPARAQFSIRYLPAFSSALLVALSPAWCARQFSTRCRSAVSGLGNRDLILGGQRPVLPNAEQLGAHRIA